VLLCTTHACRLKALGERNTAWATDPSLFVLLADNAKLIAHDGQVFEGKPAVIRRLGKGAAPHAWPVILSAYHISCIPLHGAARASQESAAAPARVQRLPLLLLRSCSGCALLLH
jgi:hypothetical protein